MPKVKQTLRVPHPHDGPWSWLVLFAAWTGNALILGFCISFGVLLPDLRKHFMKSRQSSAWVASLSVSLAKLLGPLTGALINRFGCRTVAMCGAALCSLSLVITSFAEHMEFMYFSYGVLFGLGSSGVMLTAYLVLSKYFTKWHPLAVGIVTGGSGVGALAYGPGLERLLAAVEWRWTFRIVAAFIVVNVLLFCVYKPNEVIKDNKNKVENEEERARHNPSRKVFDCSVWKNYRFVLVTMVASIVMFAKFIPQVHLAQYAKDLEISEERTGRLYLFLGLGTSISRPAGGMLCQVKRVKALFVFQVSVTLMGVAFLILPYLTSYQLLIAFAVLFGLIDGLYMTSMNIAALKCFDLPEKKSSAYGILTLCASVFIGSGPPVAGLLADVYGTYNPSFYMAGACCLLAAAVLCFVPCLKKNQGNREEILIIGDNSETAEQFVVCDVETVL